ncbi:DUF7282 domain-containing protein [Pseudoroseicyclus tamaricis]|uniref:DUF7282 domain-containing protein n=1 Tax=Pseudoroseicyclus tamaricis TaxID=2705421 RepID=A0A6B2JT59_9RHOB|nr:hypothetical protein [Pseudoroseicyclus tamaricis]NDV01428.1 hypothetical protein [Pseudoroseicyclus tamaricis]
MKTLFLTTAATALAATAATAQSDMEPSMGMSAPTYGENSVAFSDVVATNDGYLVLQEVDEMGEPIADRYFSAPITAGANDEVTVELPEGLNSGSRYTASLYEESGDNAMFDYDGDMADTPVMMDGQPLMARYNYDGEFFVDDEETPINAQAVMEDDATAGVEPVDEMAEDEMSDDMDMSGAPMVDVSDVMFDGDTATFSTVMADVDGYLVIHAVEDGETLVPQSLGHTWVTAGENTDVAVTIDYDYVEGEDYVAMLHEETNGNETYEFGIDRTDVDTPVTVDGEVVAEQFTR